MSDPLIVLCDDEVENANEWQHRLAGLPSVQGRFEIEVVQKDQFESDVQTLEARRRSFREQSEPDESETVFDRARILIVDYDLFGYMPDQLLTGDSIAYLARTYSECGFIVGVNQDRVTNPFDATLIAHRGVSTDLSIGGDQIANPGLWSGDPDDWEEFRPWSWPVLPERSDAIEALATRLLDLLDSPLSDVIGIAPESFAAFSRPVVALLEVPGVADASIIRLRDWVQQSQMGIRSGDRVEHEHQLARVAAARLAKWLESVLLPGQDFLVDAPHLAERRPGLLTAPTDDPNSWRATTQLGMHSDSLGLDDQRLAKYRFGGNWLSRPAWRWDQIASDPELDELRSAARPHPPLVFAEDTSRFVPAESARRFSAGVEPPFRSRWLQIPETGPQYLPAFAAVGE